MVFPCLCQTQIPLNDRQCKPRPQWPDSYRCRLVRFFLHWTGDLHVKTVIRHSMKFGLYHTRQIIRSLISFTSLKTKTVVDNMLPAVYWTRFMPTSAINWHVSRGSGVQIVNLLELWRLTYDLTHNHLKIWARCGLALSRWKHVCVMECLKRGEEINASPCDGILLGKTWIRLLGSR
jgi:hypothetical protein